MSIRNEYLGTPDIQTGRGRAAARPNGARQIVPAPDSHRPLPSSAEAEQGVLGSMLLSPLDSIVEAMEKISSAHFYIPAHQSIFSELVTYFEERQGVDLITFTQRLRDRNVLEKVGGASFITSLFSFVPTAANLGYYLEIVQDKFTLRELIRVSTEIVRSAYEEQDDVKQLVDDAQAKITAVALDQAQESPVQQVQEAVEQVYEEIVNARKMKGRVTGLSTGFVDFDRTTLGLTPGEMIVLGARPSMGKTSLAMQIAQYVAMPHREAGRDLTGQPVLIFSIETAAKRLMFRTLCSRCEMNIQDLRRGCIPAPEEKNLEEIARVASELMAAPLYIDESPSLKIFEFKARARQAVARHGVKLIVIDYLQLMKSPSKRAEFSKTLEITEVSIAIKEIARSLHVPIIAIAQLNREVESRSKARPRMSDLRESGQLEQDADMILLLHREDYYLPEGSDERAAAEGKALLIVAKQKDGPTAEINLAFRKEFARFDNLTKALLSNNPAHRQGAKPG